MIDNDIIPEYFRQLIDWKKLPAYKLETRIDSLIGFVLPKVLRAWNKDYETEVIIPEFPLRLGTIYPKKYENTKSANRSYKVDFYVRTKSNKNLFIEFKTASASRKNKQDKYLQDSTIVKMKLILDGIITIHEATSYKYKIKYNYLLNKFKDAGLVKQSNDIWQSSIVQEEIKILYI